MSVNESFVDINELNENPDPAKWRDLVIKAVDSVLINMDVRDVNRHNDIHTGLDFILNASQRLPEIFVNHERFNDSASNDERCFTNWVISHLMKILSILPKLHIRCKGANKNFLFEKQCEMESKIADIFCSFTSIIRIYSHSHFLRILEDFTTSLFDVYEALELFIENRSHTAIPLKQFQNDGECPDFEAPIIFLIDSDSCLEILNIILRVVQSLLTYSCFFPHILLSFWPLMLKMVQFGDCALKSSSLRFLRHLVEFSQPSLEQFFELIDMMFEMIKGIADKADDECAIELEQEICKSLESLFTSNDIFYLHKVPIVTCIFYNLLDIFIDPGINEFDIKMVIVLVDSLTKCCKFLCLKSDDEYENNISQLISIGRLLSALVLNNKDEQFMECCQNFFLQVIKSEVDHHFCEKMHSQDSSERTILEMRELQCSAKDVSGISQHLLNILMGLIRKLESSLTARNNMHCEITLSMIRWFYEIVSLGSGLLGTHVTNDDKSIYRPPLCDESLKLLQLLLNLLIENSKNKKFVRHCFEEITEILICIVYMTDLFDLDFELCSMVIGFASLPWLSSEMNCLDLKLKNLKSYFKLSDQISDYFDEKALKNCIYLLCTTSKLHLAHQWRFHTLRKAWSETKVYLKCAILENMVIARHRISSFGLQFKLDILEEAFKTSDELLEISVISSLKNLLCSMSGHARIFRPTFHYDGKLKLKTHIFFTCEGCQMLQEMSHTMETNSIYTTSVSNNQACSVLKIFKKLFHSKHVAVRLGLVKCFKSFYLHLHMFSQSNEALLQEFIEEGMSMMKDVDHNVRMEFSEIICDLLPKQMNRKIVEEWILTWINDNIDVTGNSSSFVETYLLSLSHLAWVSDDELLLSCISIILNIYLFPNDERLEVMAEKHLKLICTNKDTTMSLLFKRFAKPICQALSICLYETKKMKPNWNILEFLKKVAYIFSFESAQIFLKENEALILPSLIMKADDITSILLKCLSQVMGDNSHMDCVVRVIGQIFCHIVLIANSKDDHRRAYEFLEREANLSLYELLNMANHVEGLLLIHLGSNRVKVFNGLNIWMDVKAYFDDQPKVAKCPQKDLAECLQPNLLGILVYFDKYLNDYGTSMKEKLEAYESLKSLIELMGEKHITQVRMRLMKTIKIGLQFKDKQFCKLCCEVWSTFVKTVNLSVFGPMLIQVLVFLLPLYDQFPDEIGQIFTYLIVENRAKLHQYFGDLFIVQPELKDVKIVLMNYQEHGEYGCKTLPQKIETLSKGIAHDTLEVRQMALSKLRELLKSSKTDIHDLMQGDEIVAPIISQMVTALLRGCRESDSNVRNLTGQCFGEIGAIDPRRLELLTPQRNIRLDFLGALDGDSFCLELINEMTKAFVRVDDSFQDCVAYAIQELIKTCELQIGSEKWNQFSEDAIEIMTPLISSKYKMNIVFNWDGLQKPIYGSERGKTFEKWVCSFAGYLGSMISSEKCVRVFQACYGVLRHDPRVAVLLLPVISFQILLEDKSECCDMLLQEILAVLNSSKYVDGSGDKEEQNISTSDMRHRCTQAVFSLLDRIGRFLKHQTSLSTIFAETNNKDKKEAYDKNIDLMQTFLKKVPQETISSSSFNCGAYTRSLKHYELHIKSSNSNFHNKESVDFLLKLYLALDEPDGVSGVMAMQQVQPSLTQQIHCFESVGLLSDASTCYDHALRLDPSNLMLKKGLLKIRLDHGELNSVLNLANGMINNDPSSNYLLNTFRVEAAWKLGEWDKLEHYLDSENQSVDWNIGLGSLITSFRSKESQSLDWNIGLGKLLMSIKSRNFEEFNENITPLRLSVMVPLSAASIDLGSYHMAYESIIRLHMLSEVEEGAHCLFNYQSDDMKDPQALADWLKNTIHLWGDRMDLCQNSYKSISPILDLHRALLQLIGLETEINVDTNINSCWLASARIARECGLKQTAHSSLLSAGDDYMPEFCMEKATCFWDKGNFDQSKSCLEKAYQALSNDEKFMSDSENKINLSKLLLQLTRYYDELSSVESQKILQMFKDVREMNSKWEDSYFYAGKYYDKMMSFTGPDKKWSYSSSIIGHFLQSLLCGSQYIYQSLPRLITLWLDFDDHYSDIQDSKPAKVAELDKINKAIASTSKKLPVYQFLVVLPQLISRICHPNKEVFKILKEIIVMVMGNYPQQVMWNLIAVSKSTYNMRSKRCQEIFTEAKNNYPHLTKFLHDATKMADLLITLCNKNVKDNVTTIHISQVLKQLLQLLNDKDFSQILVPLQKQMIPTLPNVHANPSNHIPFSSSPIFIAGIEDKVDVLASLQKPKKVTFKGSDGKNYVMLCKPKDDLRKDARLMEFTNFVNGCLKKNRESRKRNLHIRTFTVTPLSEDCGMLEWVPNTNGLRPILMKLYKEKGIYMSGSDLRKCQTPPKDSLEKKLSIYKNVLLAKHPPIFSDWFLRVFPDPTSWYCARRAFGRTTAVMSMVGYILGLGDRHGENILLDATCGECVHVDFSCLFNKGETFEYPEVVPFRLTQNMIDAMGVLGYEGIFRKSCEATLKVMREEMDSLMSILRPFIFDPLLEWKKSTGGRNNNKEMGETLKDDAVQHVKDIEIRLRGHLGSKYVGVPLSVEGQVSTLINDATNEKNLCRMYIGWASYL